MAARPILIENIRELVTCDPSRGEGKLGILRGGKLLLAGEAIAWVGEKGERPPAACGRIGRRVDAAGCVVLPGLIDPHTHLIFAGSREEEFSLKCSGQKTYAQIAAEGGGILATMKATRRASLAELVALGRERCATALAFGITTLEVKSGYALDLESELKMLAAVARLARQQPIDLLPTFLGAHDFPPEYQGRREGYVDLLCQQVLPRVARQRLAIFVDVFCEDGFFTVEQSRRLLRRAGELGFLLKLHADELAHSGGAALAAEMGAVSADHLLYADGADMEKMAARGVTPVLLPTTSFFSRLGRYADARGMIERGLPVALATDFNPGSSMTQNLQLVLNFACTQMRMSAAEAILGVTRNAARALALSDRGQLVPGKLADLAFFDLPGSASYLAYEMGNNRLQQVWKKGRQVWKRN